MKKKVKPKPPRLLVKRNNVWILITAFVATYPGLPPKQVKKRKPQACKGPYRAKKGHG